MKTKIHHHHPLRPFRPLAFSLQPLAFSLLLSCTVAPKPIVNTQPSFDGNEPNSGLICLDAQGNGVITPHARERYNSLMAAYGGRFSPPVKPGEGLAPTATNTFLLDRQHRFYFETAARWQRQDHGGAR